MGILKQLLFQYPHIHTTARIWCEGNPQNYIKLFVAHNVTQNNAQNQWLKYKFGGP